MIRDMLPIERFGLRYAEDATACIRKEGSTETYCGSLAANDIPEGNPKLANGQRMVQWHCHGCNESYRRIHVGHYPISYDF